MFFNGFWGWLRGYVTFEEIFFYFYKLFLKTSIQNLKWRFSANLDVTRLRGNLSIVRVPKILYNDLMNRADIEDLYGDDEPEMLFADGYDEAIEGVTWDGERTRVVYSVEKILNILMERDEMTYDEASEFFDFNIAGSHMGVYTPLYLET